MGKFQPRPDADFFRPGPMGTEYVQNDERCPRGFQFFSNFEWNDEKVAEYRAQADEYVVVDKAFADNGQYLEGCVAVFKKEKPKAEEK